MGRVREADDPDVDVGDPYGGDLRFYSGDAGVCLRADLHLLGVPSDCRCRCADVSCPRRCLLLGLGDGGVPDRQPAGRLPLQPLSRQVHRGLHGGRCQIDNDAPPTPFTIAAMPEERISSVTMTRVTQQASAEDTDVLAVEEPLEIRVAWEAGGETREKNIAVTMRTPGDDADLASGFLFTEALIRSHEEIDSIRHWGSPNIIRLSLQRGAKLDVSKLDRHFYTTPSSAASRNTPTDPPPFPH